MELTKENFASETASWVMLVDFWAPWCGPCQAMMPTLDNLMNEGYTVGKVNVDEQGELAGMFRVMSIPTFVVMKDGKAVEQVIGGQSIDTLKELMNKHK